MYHIPCGTVPYQKKNWDIFIQIYDFVIFGFLLFPFRRYLFNLNNSKPP